MTEPLKPRLDQGPDYERGFVDGMLYQTQTSVDKAVNAIAQPAQEPSATRPCRSCDGTGERFTGIDEAPTSICKPCKGTGQIALAQPAQEPDRQALQANGTHPAPCARHCEATAFNIVIRHLEAQLAQPAQEPVAWGVFEGNLHDLFLTQAEAQEMAALKGSHAEVRPLYTTPPQRTWVGLTDEEMLAIEQNTTCTEYESWLRKLVVNIEAKLKEKNT